LRAAAEAGAARRELVHAARLALPAVARGVLGRALHAVGVDGLARRAVVQVVGELVAAAHLVHGAIRLPQVVDVVHRHRVVDRLRRARAAYAGATTDAIRRARLRRL